LETDGTEEGGGMSKMSSTQRGKDAFTSEIYGNAKTETKTFEH
jgi:hypothetical protein